MILERDRLAAGIEITPEMVAAGVSAFEACVESFGHEEIVAEVYIAMRQALNSHENSCVKPEPKASKTRRL